MPYFRDPFSYLQSPSAIFEQAFKPDSAVPHSGIYRCSACGFEIAVAAGSLLLSNGTCSTHDSRRNSKDGKVSWRLVAATMDTNG
jgi:hypothetical protein